MDIKNKIEYLNILRDIGHRLKDLSRSRGIPATIAESHENEAKILEWAFTELNNCVFVDIFFLKKSSNCIINPQDGLYAYFAEAYYRRKNCEVKLDLDWACIEDIRYNDEGDTLCHIIASRDFVDSTNDTEIKEILVNKLK
jgi:hypothetical protein